MMIWLPVARAQRPIGRKEGKPMRMTHRSLYYLAGYLIPAGIALIAERCEEPPHAIELTPVDSYRLFAADANQPSR